jgi:hypothetical protein
VKTTASSNCCRRIKAALYILTRCIKRVKPWSDSYEKPSGICSLTRRNCRLDPFLLPFYYSRPMNTRQVASTLCTLLLTALIQSRAQVSIINTWNNPAVSSEVIGDPSLETKVRYEWAQSFQTPAQELTLSQVQLSLRLVQAPNPPSLGEFHVRILSDNGGIPGQVLLTLQGPTQPMVNGTLGQIEAVSYAGSMVLTPNTTYWLGAIDQSLGRYGWQYTGSDYVNDGLGTLGPQARGTLPRVSKPQYWELMQAPEQGGNAFLFSITAIPEPSFTAAAAAVILSLFFFVQRRPRGSN